MTAETHVVMCGSSPMAATETLEAAQTFAAEKQSRWADRELRWDDHHDGPRLMSRTGGKGRFAWTQYWIATVPTLKGGQR